MAELFKWFMLVNTMFGLGFFFHYFVLRKLHWVLIEKRRTEQSIKRILGVCENG